MAAAWQDIERISLWHEISMLLVDGTDCLPHQRFCR
jgi:hypothetical protein